MSILDWNPNFPTNDEYWNVNSKSLFDNIRDNLSKVKPNISPIEILMGKDISVWQQVLYNKINKIQIAYVMTLHYYKDGFNDIDGNFDKLNNEDVIRKSMFDFSIDTTFNYIYSAFDSIGQILNKRYSLGLDKNKIYFHSVISDKLKAKNSDLYEDLKIIKDGEKFKSAKLRNLFFHQIPPTEMLGFLIEFKDGNGTIKKPLYISAKELVDMLNQSLEVLNETIILLEKM